MKKLLYLLPLTLIIGCQPKTPSESEALLKQIHETQSKTKVGINYLDYSKTAQELQIKLDDFSRSQKSQKLKYAGNLASTAESYIKAAHKDSGEEWSPQQNWKQAEWNYEYLKNCQDKNEDCYGFNEQTDLILVVSQRQLEETNKLIEALNK